MDTGIDAAIDMRVDEGGSVGEGDAEEATEDSEGFGALAATVGGVKLPSAQTHWGDVTQLYSMGKVLMPNPRVRQRVLT